MLLLSSLGCSSAPPAKYADGEHRLGTLVLYNLQVRRPVGPGADPSAEQGEPGWKSDPLPDARLDCKPATSLFVSVSAPRLRSCLESLQKKQSSVEYALKREVQPIFALEDEAKAPPCLKELIPRLPVPREIVFQAEEEKELRCFTSRLDLDAEKVFGVKLPFNRYRLKLEFPLARVPSRDRDIVHLLMSWVITPFFRQDPREIVARPVPEAICARCFEGSRLYKPWEVPGYWPEILEIPETHPADESPDAVEFHAPQN
jgi:hypothetical protein